MSEYVILTDSSADLDDALVKALGVEVVPLKFIINGETYSNYPDNREMEPVAFYDRLRAQEVATTAAINLADAKEGIEPFFGGGYGGHVLAFYNRLYPPSPAN